MEPRERWRFVKMHGLGNDYLVLEAGPAITAESCRALCDRHRGIGSDGILEPWGSDRADAGVRIWNPDGSVAEKSGNGLRIFARWWADREQRDTFVVDTGPCLVPCEVGPARVRVGMGRAAVSEEVLELEGTTLQFCRVDVGNPHCVLFDTTPLDDRPWRALGARLEVHAAFPERTNVQFALIVDGTLRLRIWERGAGETSASGSSSCAAVAAAVATGRLAVGTHTVHMPGGRLTVHIDASLDLLLEGPVEPVMRCEWLG